LNSLDKNSIPTLQESIFSDENLRDSNPLYKRVRDMGDAVWVPEINQYVVARYADVIKALSADTILISGKGVSVNEAQNAIFSDEATITQTSTLTSDGRRHSLLKRYAMKPLLPKNLKELKQTIQDLANMLVSKLATGETIDGMASLASHIPLQIIANMVGIKIVSNEKMLEWAEAIFDSFGPEDNPRTQAAFPKIGEFINFYSSISRDDMVPGGWADQLMLAVDKGELSFEEAHSLTSDYVIPSLDTTIHSTAELVIQLAKKPEAFDKLRQEPDLISSAVLEAVRLATPLRGFTRYVTEDFKLSDSALPAGSRVWLWYASANRDERHYDNPDEFDVERKASDHVGWGHGVHSCIGKHLAQIEIESVLRALIKYVKRIEVNSSSRIINNSAQGYESLSMQLIPK
jgi:cytochrome P450